MKELCSDEGVSFGFDLDNGESLDFLFREIRRQTTGLHALVAIYYGQLLLSYDTFNIGRREDRIRLANAAHKALPGEVSRDAVSAAQLEHDLGIACLRVPKLWEQDRHIIARFPTDSAPPPIAFAIRPYIMLHAGTIFFAPPGAGKTYLLMSMALAISSGNGNLWRVDQPSPVLYVNLERDATSLWRREVALRAAMGIDYSDVHYLHGRGLSLDSLQQKIRAFLLDHGEMGIVLDSISRAQVGGSLIEDTTANRLIDMMNGLPALWWAAIGHTPRVSADHTFGSIHFDAGMDIGVQVKAEAKEKTLGVSLRITKANDIGRFPPLYMALEFDALDGPVVRIRKAKEMEFPELLADRKVSRAETIIAYIDANGGTASPTEVATGTGIALPNVSAILKDSELFVDLGRGKDGRSRMYGVATEKAP